MMTPTERKVFADNARNVLFDYVNKIGYPNIQNEIILQHLPNMWRALENNGLIKPGMTFQGFQNIANEQFFMSLIQGGRF